MEFIEMNYPLLPVEAGQNVMQIFCFIATMIVAMFSWMTCMR